MKLTCKCGHICYSEEDIKDHAFNDECIYGTIEYLKMIRPLSKKTIKKNSTLMHADIKDPPRSNLLEFELNLLLSKAANIFIDFLESDERERLDPESESRLMNFLERTKEIKKYVENIKTINDN